MRDFVVEFLTCIAEEHPYVLLACAFIGFLWLVRSAVHKLRLFTRHLTKEVREGKVEVHEWAGDLAKLKRELTTWKADP